MMRATILFAGITAITHAASDGTDAQRQSEEKSDPNQLGTKPVRPLDLGRLSVRKVINPSGLAAYKSPEMGYHDHEKNFCTGDYILVEVKEDTECYRAMHHEHTEGELFMHGKDLEKTEPGFMKQVTVNTSFDIQVNQDTSIKIHEGSTLYLNFSEELDQRNPDHDLTILGGHCPNGEPIPNCSGVRVMNTLFIVYTDVFNQKAVEDTSAAGHRWVPRLRYGCCKFKNFNNSFLTYYFLRQTAEKDSPVLVHWTRTGHFHHGGDEEQQNMFAPIDEMEAKFHECAAERREEKTGIAKILSAEVDIGLRRTSVILQCEQTVYEEVTTWQELSTEFAAGLGEDPIPREQFDFLNNVAAANAAESKRPADNKTLRVKVFDIDSRIKKTELVLAPINAELTGSDCSKIIRDLTVLGVKVTLPKRRLLRSHN